MSQLEDGFTKMPNNLLEQLARIRISGEAMQVFWVILRKIYGFHKKSDKIALSQLSAATGLKRVTVCKAIKKLTELNLITKKGNSMANEYTVNEHFDTWKPLPKKVTLPKKVIGITKKGNLPLPKKLHTKETITKETITKESTPNKSAVVFPENLKSEEFKKAWQEWQAFRKEKRAKLTPITIKKQLKQLSEWGELQAIRAIEKSITNGWQGLFEPKQQSEVGLTPDDQLSLLEQKYGGIKYDTISR